MTSPRRSLVAVVDDDYRVLESLEELLVSAGHAVRPFPGAKAFLADACLLEIDCLIADIAMPVVDGFELQRLVRDARPELPVFFVTARHEPSDEHRAIAQGGQGFFQKPFDAPTLLAAVAQAIQFSHRDI